MIYPKPCDEWEKQLAAIHPDDLSPTERKALNEHVALCPACKAVLNDYKEMDALIRSSLMLNRPLELWQDIAVREVHTEPLPLSTSLQVKQQGDHSERDYLYRTDIVGRKLSGLFVAYFIIIALMLFHKSHVFAYTIIKALHDDFINISLLYIATFVASAISIIIFVSGVFYYLSKCSHYSKHMICIIALSILIILFGILIIPSQNMPNTLTGGMPSSISAELSKNRDVALVSPTPTSQTPEAPKQEALNSAQHYTSLAMARKFSALYNLLSSDLRNRMDYDQFIHDPDYVLYPDSCWREGDMILSLEKDEQTWDVGVFMTQVTCTGGITMATYDWHLRVLVPMDNSGAPVVTQASLYPTGN